MNFSAYLQSRALIRYQHCKNFNESGQGENRSSSGSVTARSRLSA